MTDARNLSAVELCVACGAELELPDGIVLGEVLWCADCGVELEVIRLDPLQLELFEEEEK